MKDATQIQELFRFLAAAYHGNWQYRWADTPYFDKALKEGKVESVTGHVWATMLLWFELRRVCPRLDSLVDSLEIYEIILNHDLGETGTGDTPLYKKIIESVNNKRDEKMSLEVITRKLPEIQRELLDWFDEYEQDIHKIDRLEILVAKWLDNIQGNHFGVTFGSDFSPYSDAINSILQIRFVVFTNRLIEVLQHRHVDEAVEEVRRVARYHAEEIKAAGIRFDSSKLNLD